MALPPAKVAQIEALLKEEKLSKREISRRLKVSRVTIDRIEKRMLFPEELEPKLRIMHFNEGDGHLADEIKPTYHRCKGCGGMQQDGIPCQVCLTRKRLMQEYDCYMDELLGPIVVSPLSTRGKPDAK